ncbi:MAG: biotin/lipoyl-binding protein [Roseiflexaceae bacterium]
MKRVLAGAATGVLMLGLLSACSLPTPPGAPSSAAAEPTVVLPDPNRIVADGIVLPLRSVDLAFTTTGTVAEVLVQEGDLVPAGAPLARLDARDLELQVAQQQAGLAQAQASYNAATAGATDQEIAAQQAALRNAEAQFERTRSGNATEADLASARAQLRAAQAALAALKNPTAADLSNAELRVRQAQANLDSLRASTSATKTNAELSMKQAVDALTQAQASYATAKENWVYVQDTGNDPTNPTITDASGKKRDNKLNDVQVRQYYEAFVQAEAALRSAEKGLQQAQVSFDQARQEETIQVQQAEASLANAQAQFEALKNPSAKDLAQAQARVAEAQATLQKTQQGGTNADVAAAQAAVDQAQAQLEQLTTAPRPVDLAELQARIEAAQVALEQAEYNLTKATLAAPFAGMIAERTLEVGQQIGATSPAAFVLADLSAWKIETDNLNERDVVRIKVGSAAELRFDALPDLVIPGTVTAIQPRGVDRYGDMTYTVTVTPNNWDDRLRWNMSAVVSIVAE